MSILCRNIFLLAELNTLEASTGKIASNFFFFFFLLIDLMHRVNDPFTASFMPWANLQ